MSEQGGVGLIQGFGAGCVAQLLSALFGELFSVAYVSIALTHVLVISAVGSDLTDLAIGALR